MTDRQHPTPQARKPWCTPTLTKLGTLDDLTRDISGLPTDALTGSQFFSDRTLKEHFVSVESRDIFARLMELPIETWNYKAGAPAIRHTGHWRSCLLPLPSPVPLPPEDE